MSRYDALFYFFIPRFNRHMPAPDIYPLTDISYHVYVFERLHLQQFRVFRTQITDDYQRFVEHHISDLVAISPECPVPVFLVFPAVDEELPDFPCCHVTSPFSLLFKDAGKSE